MSWGKMSTIFTQVGAKCPWGILSFGAKCLGAKCPLASQNQIKNTKLLFETKPFHHLLENLPLAILDHILHKLMLKLLSLVVGWSSIHCQNLVRM